MTAREVDDELASISLALLIFDQRLRCRSSRMSIGLKGIEKLGRASPAGCHKQIDLKWTGCGPSSAGQATTVSMAR